MSVLLLSKNPFLTLAVARCLGGAGEEVHVMGPDAWPTVRFSRRCQRYARLPLDLLRPPYEAALSLIQRYCDEHRIEAVVPADVDAGLLVSAVQDRLTGVKVFPVPPGERIRELNDKWEFARFCMAHGIPHPATRRIESLDQLDDQDWSRALMVKPILGGNSEGVARVESREQLDRHLRENAMQPPFLLQEFKPGSDIDMSILADHGRLVAWTIQVNVPDKQTREFLRHEGVYQVGRALVEKSGYHGVAHFDMRASPAGETHVLECNPRFWLSSPFSMWAGVNFAELGLRLARGEDPAALSATMIVGPCTKPSLGPRSLAKGLLGLARMNPSSRHAFQDAYADPAPQMMAKVYEVARRLGLHPTQGY